MSNSDVPGPYRQDSAGDYGSADYGGGYDRASYDRASSDRGDYRDQGSEGRHSGGGGRRRRPEPSGDDDRGGSWASAARPDAPPQPRGARPAGGRPARNSEERGNDRTSPVAQNLRDRLGVSGGRGTRGQRGAPRGQAGRAPDGYERYGSDSYDRPASRSGGYDRPRGDQPGGYGQPGARDSRTQFSDQGYSNRTTGGYRTNGGATGRTNGRATSGYRTDGRPGGGAGGGAGGGGAGGGGRRTGPSGLAPRGGRGQRRSLGEWFKSGDWWRRWTWKKALGVATAICLGVPVLFLVYVFAEYEHTPIPTETSALATASPSTIYFSNGTVLATASTGGVNRQILTAAQIPQVMNDAIVAAEDRHFYSEGGISVTGILRAAYEDVKGGSASQGGSTLTEQFVKNYYTGFASNDNSDKNASDKFRQALVAVKLAHSKSKSWILTEYLNTVYLGEGAYGVGAAAQVYFGETASQLSPAQAAMIAAMANLPGYFQTDPRAGAPYQALVARWQYVLGNMVRDNALTSAQKAQILKAGFPVVHLHLSSQLNGQKGYLYQMVTQELAATYHISQAQLGTSGLKIYTTFKQQLMGQLSTAIIDDKRLMAEDGQGLPLYAHVGAVLENPVNGQIEAVYGGPGYGLPQAQCARVSCQYNMAEDPKQVGSSFKPYVLATAVSQGMDVQSSILNSYSPIWIPEGTSMTARLQTSLFAKPVGSQLNQGYGYLEFNEASENLKAIGVQQAAALSSDPAFEDLAHRAGVQNVIDMAKQFGVGEDPFNNATFNTWQALNKSFGTTCPPGGCADTNGSVAVALGEGELTAVEQASMFATLADGGTYHTPHVITKIVQGNVALPIKVQTRQVLTQAAAGDVDFALSADNTPGGTAYPDAAWPGYQVIGKTGTTQTAQDAWFIGAIPQQSLAVTLFTNDQDSNTAPGSQTLDILPVLPNNATGGYGGAWPAYIWHTFMTTAFAGLTPQSLPAQDYTGFIPWNQVGGGAPASKPKPTHPSPSSSPCVQNGFGQPCQPGNGGFPTAPPTAPGFPVPTPGPSGGGPTGCVPTVINPCTGQTGQGEKKSRAG